MPSAQSTSAAESPVVGTREAQRLATRARLFEAAVAEIGRSGLAGTDVAKIAATVGVARGTFYFHFPTKEHVLVELERAEELRIAAKLATKKTGPGDLLALLKQLVREVLDAEQRLGPVLFRDMLALHFSATRPVEDELAAHPLVGFVITAMTDAQAAGRVSRAADTGELGVIFLTGMFALLATSPTASRARTALLNRFVKTIVQGMEAR